MFLSFFFFFYSSCNAVQCASVNGLGKLQQREGEAVRGAQDQKLNRRKGGREREMEFFFFFLPSQKSIKERRKVQCSACSKEYRS